MINGSFVAACLIVFLVGCNDSQKLQDQLDTLRARADSAYTPGFGEFMSNVQVHHAKLWFAGKNRNWELADFELAEIRETIDAIQTYRKERIESKALPILVPALDDVAGAVRQHDVRAFIRTYTALTKTCNACHQAVKMGFNVIKIPDTPPFSNQEFTGTHR